MIPRWLKLMSEILKQFSLRHPRKCALTGVSSLGIVGAIIGFVFYSFYIVKPEALSSVRWMCIPAIAFGYLMWLTLFLVGFLIVPKTKADFITYATSDREVDQSLEVGRDRVRRGVQSDIENETDEVLSSYTAEFKGLFGVTMLSYLSHIVTIILFGAVFTYVVVHTTPDKPQSASGIKEVVVYTSKEEVVHTTPVNQQPHSAVKELDRDSPFVSHIYFSGMTMLTIGFGYNHPVSELSQWGVIIQCFSILIIIIFGLSYIVSFEQSRIDNVRKAILSDLRQALPIGGTADSGSPS